MKCTFPIKNHSIQPHNSTIEKHIASRLNAPRYTIRINDFEGFAQSIIRNHLPISTHNLSTPSKIKSPSSQNYTANKLSSFLLGLQRKLPSRNANILSKTEILKENIDFKNSVFLPTAKRYSIDGNKKTYHSNKVISKRPIDLNSSFAYRPLKLCKYSHSNDKGSSKSHTKTMAKIIKKALYKSIGYTPSELLHIKKVPYPRIDQAPGIKMPNPQLAPLKVSREEISPTLIHPTSVKSRNRKLIFLKTYEGIKVNE